MSSPQSVSPLNRLAQESSPYLLQHARNPVDWYPWGAEAWERARRENKPVLVSIGYSACHWCHVMERESFEDPEIARRQNELVVSIKVDREERPDVDEVYMEVVQLIHGHGGWPLNVFCLPDGRPFFGGTYFPPTGRMGMNSWLQVLEAVSKAYQDPANKIEEQADRLLSHIGETTSLVEASLPSTQEALAGTVVALKKIFDSQHAGFGQAPKFPQPFFLSLLLQRDNKAPHDAEAEEMALQTLRAMATGGVYDQLGGGFHRYAVDAGWLVPHFEKMLYDNALLVPIYVDAWKLTNDSVYRRVAEETLEYLLSEMRTSDGLFFSSTDADSEGEEGKFFTWTFEEIREVLNGDGMADDEIASFMKHYGVTQTGNFEGRNILNIPGSSSNYRRELIQEEVKSEGFLERGRSLLRERRSERVHPSTDTKIIAAWNGLAIDAFARAGMALDSPVYVAAAEQCATVLLDTLLVDDRGLRRIYAGGRASILAFLDDYACLADGLLSLYLATGDEKWFLSSELLIKEMVAKFWDDSDGGFFTIGFENEALVAKMKPTNDGATPSGNSQAARVLARLYALTGESALAERLDAIAAMSGGIMLRQAIHAPLLVHTMAWLRSHRVVAIIGHSDDPNTNALASVKVSGPVDQTLIIRAAPNSNSAVPQLRDKDVVNGRATAYVCQGSMCSAPFQDPAELEEFLAEVIAS